MTAKKMADVFFGKFSELISSEKVSDDKSHKEEKEIKVEEPKKASKEINKKILIYLSGAILLGLVIFFSI